uniref:Uncharacterized protein n=1 Tax=Panagrolaimus superbus TaxID=310955 RepID=A0A914YKU0_9BILA
MDIYQTENECDFSSEITDNVCNDSSFNNYDDVVGAGEDQQLQVLLNSAGHAYIAMIMSDSQLLLIECPFKVGSDPLKEVFLQGSRRLTILWKNNDERNGVVDVSSLLDGDDIYFFAIYKNAKIRVWSAVQKKALVTTSVSSLTANADPIEVTIC